MERSGLAVFLVAGLCVVTQCHIRKYHYVATPVSWTKAQSYCREQYTDLATVGNQADQDHLLSFTQQSAWIGLYRDQPNWQWSCREEVTFYNWRNNRFCAKVNAEGTWEDDVCDQTHFFMCYTDTDNVTQRYTLIRENRNWTVARDYCREHHTDLVTIKSLRENNAVMERGQGSVFWIGLFNEPWKWSSGAAYYFHHWNYGQPNFYEGKQKCVEMFFNNLGQGRWNDQNCAERRPFLCSYDKRELILVRENKSWEEALDYCHSYYTDLVSIISEKEHKLTALTATDAQTPHVWLGLRQSFITHSWFWVNREVLGYQKWVQAGQPQCPQSRYCGAMSTTTEDHAWTDRPCEEKLNFICYRDNTTRDIIERSSIHTEQKTWLEAQKYCRAENKDLATIYTEAEARQLTEVLGIASDTWIGLYHGPENWQWVSGERASYANWKTNLFCAAVDSEGYWEDLVCDEQHPFMCYTESGDIFQRYTLINEGKTWAAARDYCREKHTDLVTVRNHSENEAVRQRAGGGRVWIGLFNEPWKWSDGATLSYRNWCEMEPNNFYYNEKCGGLQTTGKWFDIHCNMNLPFLCQEDVRELILVRENKTWEEALDHCRSYYTDLVSIISEKEHKLTALTAIDAQTPHVWLGLRQSFITRSWFWVNREVLGYQKWVQAGQPQCPQSRYCGATSTTTEDHAWTDRPCEEKLNFICYRA